MCSGTMSSRDHGLAVLGLTDHVADFMGALYRQSKDPSIIIPVPIGWTERMVAECQVAVKVILIALSNKRKCHGL